MFKKSKNEQKLEETIDSLLTELDSVNGDSDEYAKMSANLDRLYRLKEIKINSQVCPDTLAIIAGNLAGIFLILNFERAGIITSKAINFVLKPR